MSLSEARFAEIFNHLCHLVGLLDPQGRVLEANGPALAMVGVDLAEVEGRFFWETPWWSHSLEEQQKLRQALQQAGEGRPVRFETFHLSAEGRRVDIDFSLQPLMDEQGRVRAIVPEGRDVSEFKQAQSDLMGALREIQHRVKNHLQMICSLLRLQSRRVEDAAVQQLFDTAQRRVQTMALVHDHLESGGSRVRFDLLLIGLDRLVLGSPDRSAEAAVEWHLEPLVLEVDLATPLALVAGELLANAQSFGHPPFRVELCAGDQEWQLGVADSGPGLPGGFQPERSPTMGMTLIHKLTRQLRATVHWDSTRGCRCLVRHHPKKDAAGQGTR